MGLSAQESPKSPTVTRGALLRRLRCHRGLCLLGSALTGVRTFVPGLPSRKHISRHACDLLGRREGRHPTLHQPPLSVSGKSRLVYFRIPLPEKRASSSFGCIRVRSCEIGNRRTGKHTLPADGPSSSRWAIVHPAILLMCPVRSVKPTPLIGSFRNPPMSLLLGSPRNPPQSCYSRGAGLTTLKREAGASTAPQPTTQIPKRP